MDSTGSLQQDIEGGTPLLEGYVLLVAEDPEFLNRYREILAGLGFTPLSVTSYEAAMGYLRMAIFDFVVLDEEGSSFEGRSFLERARRIYPHTFVLVVSRDRDLALSREVRRLGAAEYLQDPVAAPDLVRAIVPHLHPPNAPL
ncbi:MAG: response regulator [Terriglobia bacterium]